MIDFTIGKKVYVDIHHKKKKLSFKDANHTCISLVLNMALWAVCYSRLSGDTSCPTFPL